MLNQPFKPIFPWLGAFAAIVLWGISFVASKVALQEISPTTLIFSRTTLGTSLLIVILAISRHSLVPSPKTWRALAAMGFVGVFFHQMLQAYGLILTTAVRTGWLISLIPIWSALLSAVILGERFGLNKLTGLMVGFFGAVILVTHGEFSTEVLTLPSTKGDFLILASTVNWAVYTILGHGTLRRLGSARATAGAMFFGWVMLLPFFVHRAGWQEYNSISATGWAAVLFLGLGSSGLGYLFWYGALERIEPSRVAAFLYLEPFVTLITAIIFLNEAVRASTVMGGMLVLAGVYLVQRAPMAEPLPENSRV
jgi:drug/metabolite transporter (DMT)-like permease